MVQPSDYLRLVLILWWIRELASLGNRQWAMGLQIAHYLLPKLVLAFLVGNGRRMCNCNRANATHSVAVALCCPELASDYTWAMGDAPDYCPTCSLGDDFPPNCCPIGHGQCRCVIASQCRNIAHCPVMLTLYFHCPIVCTVGSHSNLCWFHWKPLLEKVSCKPHLYYNKCFWIQFSTRTMQHTFHHFLIRLGMIMVQFCT